MNIVVFGGAGFIGSHLVGSLSKLPDTTVVIADLPDACKRLQEDFAASRVRWLGKPDNIVVAECDITFAPDVYRVMKQFSPEVVYHLAAMLGVHNTETRQNACHDNLVFGTNNIVDACLRFPVKHLLFTSSSEVYGSGDGVSEHAPLNGRNVYALGKQAGESIVRSFVAREGGAPDKRFTVFRLFNMIGMGQVAQFCFSRMYLSAVTGKPVAVNGGGVQKRGFCDVRIAVDVFVDALTNERAWNNIYNVGSTQKHTTIRRLAEKIVSVVTAYKKDFPDEFESRFGVVPDPVIDILPMQLHFDRTQWREVEWRTGNFNRLVEIVRGSIGVDRLASTDIEDILTEMLVAGYLPHEHWAKPGVV